LAFEKLEATRLNGKEKVMKLLRKAMVRKAMVLKQRAAWV